MKNNQNCQYNLTALPALPVLPNTKENREQVLYQGQEAVLWSGDPDQHPNPPAIGSQVKIYMNGLGEGLVVGYFVEYKYLGIEVTLANPPAWYVKQNGGNMVARLFGVDLKDYSK